MPEIFIRKTEWVFRIPFGFAKNTFSYKWVVQILWLQIGVLKNGA